jgi:hypothetical protein
MRLLSAGRLHLKRPIYPQLRNYLKYNKLKLPDARPAKLGDALPGPEIVPNRH